MNGALEREHEVLAIANEPGQIKTEHKNLQVILNYKKTRCLYKNTKIEWALKNCWEFFQGGQKSHTLRGNGLT